jgi:AcrR family transcriptional regulator
VAVRGGSPTVPAPVPGRRPGRPRGGRPVADRGQLLDAAERIIRVDGPDASMEAIAASALVTKPILYREVGDKAALVTALAERLVDRINIAVVAAVADASDPRDGLRRFVDGYFRAVDGDRHLYLYVTAGSGDQGLGARLQLADRSARPLAEALAAGRERAGLDPAVAETWAYAVVGALQFATLRWMRDGREPIDTVVDAVTELLWSGLGPSERVFTPRRDRR